MLDGHFMKLSPLPVPTEALRRTPNIFCINANDVYMDIAVKKSEMDAWPLRFSLQNVFVLSSMFTVVVFGWLFRDLYRRSDTLSEHLFRVFSVPWLWVGLALGVLCMLFMILSAAWKNMKHPPIRFNRQRREVVYVPKRGCPPLYVAWERLRAGIYQTEPGSAPCAWKELRFGFSDRTALITVWHRTQMVSNSSAAFCWESIRCFMERECEQLPFIDPVEEYKRNQQTRRKDFDMMDYVLYMLSGVTTGGPLPVYLSRWVEHLSLKSLPESVRTWSAPLPAEQWQAPSDDLLAASSKILDVYRKKQRSSARSGQHDGIW